MIRAFTCFLASTGFFIVCLTAQPLQAKVVVDFEDLSPPTVYAGDLWPGEGKYWNGADGSGSFVTGGATFYNNYSSQYGTWDGWAYSNTVDPFTAGFGNQYSAYALPGAGGRTTYGVGYAGAISPPPKIEFDSVRAPVGMHVTNTTYAALSMLNGDGFAKKFGGAGGDEADWFLLTITGTDAGGNDTGSVPFYLADYQAADKADDYIVRDWTWVDLTGLGNNVKSLQFSLSSSDVDAVYGMNTPAYFAMDNLTTVPEPGTAALCGIALVFAAVGYTVRRRKR